MLLLVGVLLLLLLRGLNVSKRILGLFWRRLRWLRRHPVEIFKTKLLLRRSWYSLWLLLGRLLLTKVRESLLRLLRWHLHLHLLLLRLVEIGKAASLLLGVWRRLRRRAVMLQVGEPAAAAHLRRLLELLLRRLLLTESSKARLVRLRRCRVLLAERIM